MSAPGNTETSRTGGGFRLDRHVSLGHLLTTVLVAAGVVAGYVRLEEQASANAGAIERIRSEHLHAVEKIGREAASDRAFHVGDRARLSERVNGVQDQINDIDSAVSALTAKTDYIASQVDRLVARLIDGSRARAD